MCPICRIPNNPSSTYCVQCGFPLQMIDLPISPVKPPPPKLARKPNLERGPIPPIARYQLAQTIVHQVTIGSDPKADLRLPHPAVSGYHARLDRINDQWILRDLGSRNQTFLTRGKLSTALTSPTTLEVGDKIGIHPYTLVFTGSSLAPNYEIELLADNLSQVVLERHWKGNALHSQSKILLNKVSLAIEPRDFVAVLGGSGAGKSTLLKALSGYSKNEGKVYFNCYDYYGHFNSFRGQVGFVPQSDIIHGELTVETALGYAAKLRIGEHYPADELKRKVDSVIERLDLTPHKATVINNLSGGQRKRVSIAVELLTSPPLFFLDEPTSGLDPGLEADMMRLLRTLSDDGHTIVLVTHSVVNISLCDKIAVLGNGGVLVYYGPPGQVGIAAVETALAHFGVSDHADIYRVVQPQLKLSGSQVEIDLPTECKNPALQALASQINQELHTDAKALLLKWSKLLRNFYQQTATYQRLVSQPLALQHLQQTAAPAKTSQIHQSKFNFKQSQILMHRYLDIIRSDWRALLLLMLQAPVIGFILALASSKDAFVLRSQWPDAERLMAMMSCSVLWFGIINSAREVVKELPIYKRERFVNLNIFAYLLSKVTILIGVCAVQCWLLLTALALSGIRLNGSGRILPLFWEFYLNLLFVALVGLALGLLVSCTVATSERVTSAIPIVLLPQIILNPVLLSNPSGFLEIVVNLTIASKWGLVALGNSADMLKKVPPGYTDIYTSTPSGLLSAWAVLILMSLVCLALAYYMLSRKED